MKKCSKCGEVKPFEAFSKMAASKDGLQFRCKACNAAYHSANREKNNARQRAYSADNREKIRYADKARYEANREKILERSRVYRAANKEKKQDYYAANKERIRATGRERTRRIVAELGDEYIKFLLTRDKSLRFADIPDWLVEAKREQLRLKRELRK